MDRQYIEMIPKKIKVIQNGNVDETKLTDAGLFINWIRPNEYSSLVSGEIKELKLVRNQPYTDFSIRDNSDENYAKDLSKNQILKTSAIGRSVIKAEVIVSKSPELMRKVIASLFGAVVGLITVSNPFASALVGLANSEIQSEIKDGNVISLGQGMKVYNASSPKSEIKIGLKTTKILKALNYVESGYDDYGIPTYDFPELLGKGKKNGEVVLTLNDIT